MGLNYLSQYIDRCLQQFFGNNYKTGTFVLTGQNGVAGNLEVSVGTGTAVVTPGGTLNRQTNAVATGANGTETVAHTYTLPANTLASNGSGVKIRSAGTFGATANTKTLKFYWGGTALFTLTSTGNALDWNISMEVVRTSAGNQILVLSGNIGATVLDSGTVVTATANETAAQVLQVTMTNDIAHAAADLTAKIFEASAN